MKTKPKTLFLLLGVGHRHWLAIFRHLVAMQCHLGDSRKRFVLEFDESWTRIRGLSVVSGHRF